MHAIHSPFASPSLINRCSTTDKSCRLRSSSLTLTIVLGCLLLYKRSMGEGEGNGLAFAEGLKPAAGMVLVQIVFAGVNLFYKLAINDGMDLSVLVAYRYLFATVSLAPFAFFLERKIRPRLTLNILMQTFFCALFGGTLTQHFYLTSIKLTSATFTAAMANLVPAVTFVLAIVFRLENLRINKRSGQAKLLGTLVGFFGAMVLTFFKGKELQFLPGVDLLKPQSNAGVRMASLQHHSSSQVLGSIFAVGSCLCYSIWLIIQAKLSKAYPCHYSSTALMCLMGSIQAVVFAFCMGSKREQWRMDFGIRLVSVTYSGVVGSGLIVSLLAWCVKKKGPVYASVFNPLMLVIVAIFGSLLLNEKLYIGSVIGALLIVVGLYFVLWGEGKEGETAEEKVEELPKKREAIEVVVERSSTKLQCAGAPKHACPAEKLGEKTESNNEDEEKGICNS
ncbi:hypothetical protein HPP92_003210 [Vanilla planifolia]|uniref:EamA domain-containing protein n=1 Tax=Vanilla planifolia TaxID=51239 RepID=A0A835VF88_VANPL|nr:hypothetical protein HPP92_003210 [Vanilla planifolia]